MGFVANSRNKMQKSPNSNNVSQYHILNARVSEHLGSKWDDKVINDTGFTVYKLGWKVALARIKDGWTYSKISTVFKVSHGFIRKWSSVYAAHLQVKQLKRSYATNIRTKMKSISNRPHSAVCSIRDKIRVLVAERGRKYGFEGSNRIKAALKLMYPLLP